MIYFDLVGFRGPEWQEGRKGKSTWFQTPCVTSMTRMRMSFGDINWVQFGLKWVRFHFLKKTKLVISSMFSGEFSFFELGSFSRFCVFPAWRSMIDTRDPIGVEWRTPWGGRVSGIWLMGIFRWQHRQIRRFFNWGKPAGLPYQRRCRQGDSFYLGEGRRWQRSFFHHPRL